MDEQTAQALKKQTRRRVREVLARMPAGAAARKSRLACERLVGLEEFGRARVVMLYMPIAGEVDTGPVAARAWRDGKTVLVPKVRREPRDIIAVPYRTLDDPMALGRYNIREPVADEPWPAERIDFIAVPALAYDRTGNRLGKGGGYYDRFLAQPGLRATTCGLAFVEQIIDSVCVQPHDRKISLLATDLGVLRFDPG